MTVLFSTFKTLDELSDADEMHAGGKSANCARLKQAGFAVPGGLVIPSTATGAEIERLVAHPWIIDQAPGTLFAVRSSGIGEDGAGHSFAGVHETFLNVEREGVADAVLACRRSAHSAQALAYRETRQIADGDVSAGVLIQLMVAAAQSGVAFTVNPVTGADELVINAAPGLGDRLVSGQINPDEFRMRKSDGAILSARVGGHGGGSEASTASIGERALQELAVLLLRIERHFGAPQDVEWCHDGRQFWVLQSRPVTATAPAPSRSVDIEWTRANLAEVFPDLMSPQAIAGCEDLLNRAERQFMGRLLAPELGPMVRNFHGRLYFNLSQLRHFCRIGGVPASRVLRSLGHSDAIQPSDEVGVKVPLGEVLRCFPDLFRLVRNNLRTGRLMARQERRVDEWVQRFSTPRLAEIDDRAIWAQMEAWRGVGPEFVQLVLTLGSVLSEEEILQKACRRIGYSYEALVYPQLAAGERSVSTQQAFDLVALADVGRGEAAVTRYFSENDGAFADFREALAGTRFLVAFGRFLDRYGHRGPYESDWALPRYSEDPAPLLFAIKSHLFGEPPQPEPLGAISNRLERDAARAWQEFHARATPWQRLTLLPRVRATLGRLKRRYVMREKCRSDLMRVLSAGRRWHLELAERFVARGWLGRRDDYFLLRIEEIARVVSDPESAPQLRDIVTRREQQRAEQQRLRMPLLMRESELAGALRHAHVTGTADASRLPGLCVSAGCVEGEVVVIRDPRHFQQMTRGAILVAPATDPSWTPLFTLAAGVIVEVGGMLSHASTVAREYGLPALANVKDATRLLRTGDRVRLDATGGFVERSL